MPLPADDEQQPPAARPTDADIAAVCALCAARGEAPAPLGLPKSAELRVRRAAARAREAVQRRKAAERQVVAYLELLDENGAPGRSAARARWAVDSLPSLLPPPANGGASAEAVVRHSLLFIPRVHRAARRRLRASGARRSRMLGSGTARTLGLQARDALVGLVPGALGLTCERTRWRSL